MARRKPKPVTQADLDHPLTPAQCKDTAASFADLPPNQQLSAAELEMVQEEVFGKALQYGTPQEAIVAMQQRLALLRQQKARNLQTQETLTAPNPALAQDLAQLNREIAAAEQRLAAYQFQQKHQN